MKRKCIYNRTEAYKLDRTNGDFNVAETGYGDFGVFGGVSGFCYSTWSDQDMAESEAGRMIDRALES
jgi:hypothetical protein